MQVPGANTYRQTYPAMFLARFRSPISKELGAIDIHAFAPNMSEDMNPLSQQHLEDRILDIGFRTGARLVCVSVIRIVLHDAAHLRLPLFNFPTMQLQGGESKASHRQRVFIAGTWTGLKVDVRLLNSKLTLVAETQHDTFSNDGPRDVGARFQD